MSTVERCREESTRHPAKPSARPPARQVFSGQQLQEQAFPPICSLLYLHTQKRIDTQ